MTLTDTHKPTTPYFKERHCADCTQHESREFESEQIKVYFFCPNVLHEMGLSNEALGIHTAPELAV